jgi:hypothetical protein
VSEYVTQKNLIGEDTMTLHTSRKQGGTAEAITDVNRCGAMDS